jgi:hypothetical protein
MTEDSPLTVAGAAAGSDASASSLRSHLIPIREPSTETICGKNLPVKLIYTGIANEHQINRWMSRSSNSAAKHRLDIHVKFGEALIALADSGVSRWPCVGLHFPITCFSP